MIRWPCARFIFCPLHHLSPKTLGTLQPDWCEVYLLTSKHALFLYFTLFRVRARKRHGVAAMLYCVRHGGVPEWSLAAPFLKFPLLAAEPRDGVRLCSGFSFFRRHRFRPHQTPANNNHNNK